MSDQCPLCEPTQLPVLWQDAFCQVVLVDEPDYPGYCRVELKAHIKEMTDLAPNDRANMMKVVFAVETALREVLNPDKVNLASLGNMTPHVHWHVVPRYSQDKHFPQSHWAAPVRESVSHALTSAQLDQLSKSIDSRIQCAFDAN